MQIKTWILLIFKKKIKMCLKVQEYRIFELRAHCLIHNTICPAKLSSLVI